MKVTFMMYTTMQWIEMLIYFKYTACVEEIIGRLNQFIGSKLK